MTFSIAGYDPDEKEWGVAVQSKLLAVGALVPWAKAGVGAVATQAIINTSYGVDALVSLAQGISASETIDLLTRADPLKDLRQVGLIDKNGQAATYTGKGCMSWAGGLTGKHYAIQGNRLYGERTICAMEESFVATTGSLAERLLASLAAGQAAGGDRKGQQAAALLVVKEMDTDDGVGATIDLRVDDHEAPIEQLTHLYHMYELSFLQAKQGRVVPLTGAVKEQLIAVLRRHDFLRNEEITDAHIEQQLTAFLHENNFHARIQRGGMVDLDVLTYLKKTGQRPTQK